MRAVASYRLAHAATKDCVNLPVGTSRSLSITLPLRSACLLLETLTLIDSAPTLVGRLCTASAVTSQEAYEEGLTVLFILGRVEQKPI